MSDVVEKPFGLGAEFDSAADLYEAAEKIRNKGFRRWDTYSPFPIHGMDDAMGLGPSKLSALSLLGGITGLVVAFILVFYPSAIDYPMIVQGKPYFAFEPTFPVFFELTILLTAFGTIFGVLLFNLLPKWYHPAFNWDRFLKVTDDGFFVIIEKRDPLYSEAGTREFLQEIGGKNIAVIEE